MKERIVIVGAGGHAKVIIELLRERRDYEPAGCTSHAPAPAVLGLPILGTDDILPDLRRSGITAAIVAIGDNRARRDAARRVVEAGFRLVNAISARATVSPSARLGHGIAIMAGAVVNAEAHIADGAVVNTGATVDHDCRIGEYAHVAPGVHLAGGVVIGDGALVGIGSSAIPGVTVGPWAKVGAGSVIVRDVPGGATVCGVPARVFRGLESKGL